MNVTVAIDHRFRQTPDGKFWSMTSFAYSFWKRYLSVFDEVRILARIQPVDKPAESWSRADGPGVRFIPVPYYHGPLQYLQRYPLVKRTIKQAVNESEAIILRIQGQIGSCARPYLRQTGHPYGVEVVGDPYDAFAPGYVTHPLRPFLQWWLPRRMRDQCAGAAAAAYVTEFALQQRYPPAADAFTTHYSSIVMDDNAFANQPKLAAPHQKRFNLITVGTLDNLSKGADTMLETLAICVRNGLDLTWTQVGGGTYQPMLEQQAAELNITDRVHFCGWVPAGRGVWAELDKADLFILPSRQEGLSRATIEAMARGLPCIATTVGGSAELLPTHWLVDPNDPVTLAQKIGEMVSNPVQMQREAVKNLAKAHDYSLPILQQRWTALYQYLQDETAAWLTAHRRQTNKLKVA